MSTASGERRHVTVRTGIGWRLLTNMSKGKDFRPRKRGFDDDGPMSYDTEAPSVARLRRRTGRRFRRPARRQPSASPVASNAPAVDAVVKWFKADKGYGFVELAGGQGDAFLHANALRNARARIGPSGRQAARPGRRGAKAPR